MSNLNANFLKKLQEEDSSLAEPPVILPMSSEQLESLVINLNEKIRTAVTANSNEIFNISIHNEDTAQANLRLSSDQLGDIVAIMQAHSQLSYSLNIGYTPLSDEVYIVLLNIMNNLKQLSVCYPLEDKDYTKKNQLLSKLELISTYREVEQIEKNGKLLFRHTSTSFINAISKIKKSVFCTITEQKVIQGLKETVSKLRLLSENNRELANQIVTKLQEFSARAKIEGKESTALNIDMINYCKEHVALYKNEKPKVLEINSNLNFSKENYTYYFNNLKEIRKGIISDGKLYYDWSVAFQDILKSHNSQKDLNLLQKKTDALFLIFNDFIQIRELNNAKVFIEFPDGITTQEISDLRGIQIIDLLDIVSSYCIETYYVFNGASQSEVAQNSTGTVTRQGNAYPELLFVLISLIFKMLEGGVNSSPYISLFKKVNNILTEFKTLQELGQKLKESKEPLDDCDSYKSISISLPVYNSILEFFRDAVLKVNLEQFQFSDQIKYRNSITALLAKLKNTQVPYKEMLTGIKNDMDESLNKIADLDDSSRELFKKVINELGLTFIENLTSNGDDERLSMHNIKQWISSSFPSLYTKNLSHMFKSAPTHPPIHALTGSDSPKVEKADDIDSVSTEQDDCTIM